MLATVSCTKDDEPYYSGCECQSVRGYLIEVCEGQGNWERASDNALKQHEKDSDCP